MSNQDKERQRFIAAHPVAKSLGPKELDFALSIAARHENIRVYRSRGSILISRQAMYSGPFVREPFYIRKQGDRKS
jgi:hypothetical protein